MWFGKAAKRKSSKLQVSLSSEVAAFCSASRGKVTFGDSVNLSLDLEI